MIRNHCSYKSHQCVSESESEVTQSCPILWDPMDCSLLGSSIHGILQARILEWVAISFSRASSQPRDGIWVSGIAGRHFTLWASRESSHVTLQFKPTWQLAVVLAWSAALRSGIIWSLLRCPPPAGLGCLQPPGLCWPSLLVGPPLPERPRVQTASLAPCMLITMFLSPWVEALHLCEPEWGAAWPHLRGPDYTQVGLSGVPGGPHMEPPKPTSSWLYPTPQPEPETQVHEREKAAWHPVRTRCDWPTKAGGQGLEPEMSCALWGQAVGWASPCAAVSLLLIHVCGPDPNPAGQAHLASFLPWKPRRGGSTSPSVKTGRAALSPCTHGGDIWLNCPWPVVPSRRAETALHLVVAPVCPPAEAINWGELWADSDRTRTLFFAFQVCLDTVVPRGPLEMRAAVMAKVLSQVGGSQLCRCCIRRSGCSSEPPGDLFCETCLGAPSSGC